MEIKTIKALLDACYQAKRIRDLLPALPQGVTPSYIHYLDTIESLEQQGTRVKVSDISDALNLPRPGVTRTVKEMQAKGYDVKLEELQKDIAARDKADSERKISPLVQAPDAELLDTSHMNIEEVVAAIVERCKKA